MLFPRKAPALRVQLLCLLVFGTAAGSSSRVYFASMSLTNSIRGGARGGYLYEENPNFIPSSRQVINEQIVTLGDLPDPSEPGSNYYVQTPTFTPSQSTFASSSSSLAVRAKEYAVRLHQTNRSLSVICWTNLAVFLMWRIPALLPILQKHFVASLQNVKSGRPHSLILSSVSHIGALHLFFNTVALLSLGPIVQKALANTTTVQWPLYPLLLGASLAGSTTFLLVDRRLGSCLGLSGVTMALLAVFARFYPQHTLRFLVGGIIPIQLQANSMLQVSLVWSLFGSLANSKRQNIAHGAHLGGILFGLAYYEVWKRRVVNRKLSTWAT